MIRKLEKSSKVGIVCCSNGQKIFFKEKLELLCNALRVIDFDVIADSSKQFWGYSDLTTILNAIYTKTGKTSVLYQVRNLISDCGEQQKEDFRETVMNGKDNLQQISYEFVQGDHMEGIVVAGVLLGTFTQLEQEKSEMQMEELILRYVGKNVPVAKTKDIGHGKDAKAIEIGGEMKEKIMQKL